MNSNPFISIIVVNYNSSEELKGLMPSLEKCGYDNYEIIVVDNASPNDDLTEILELYPEIHFVQSKENLGFAGANNLGMQAAKGDFYLFLNPDVVVAEGFIQPMISAFELNPKIGLVSPKIKYFHKPSLIQYAGCTKMCLFTMRTFSPGKGKKDGPLYSVTKKTYFGHGAAMMVRKEVVDAVGRMNERYFLYYEEMDWCQRMLQHGYEIYYVASSVVYHKESAITQKDSPLKTFYLSRNRMLFARLHSKTGQLLLYILYSIFVLLPKNILQYLTQPLLLKAYLRGLTSHLSKNNNY